VITAIKRPVLFETMTDYSNAAGRAGGCERMNCAFETVKGVGATIHDHLNGLVVVIATSFASRHRTTPAKVPENRKAHPLALPASRPPRYFSGLGRFGVEAGGSLAGKLSSEASSTLSH
jgi:hypothetical protein